MSTKRKVTTTPLPSSRTLPLLRSARRETVPARARVKLTPGEVVKMTRELHDMSQARLAKLTGMTQPTISGIESGSIVLGADRAEKLARVLRVHPAVILWPNWEDENESVAAG